jgi:TRAP transporter TAXI family solute receptor
MEPDQTERNVGAAMPVPSIIALIVALLMIIGGVATYRTVVEDEARRELVIATGAETGTYHALGLALGRLLEEHGVVDSVTVIPTDGSVANMQLIAAEDVGADLAFIQSNAPAPGQARLIAPLYDEVLHILVTRDASADINSIHDLNGRRVSLGAAASGTRQIAERILEHFDAEPGEDLAIDDSSVVERLTDGSIDAAFILTAIPSTTVEQLAQLDAVRFLSLGDPQESGNEADALALVNPSLHATNIPRSTYVRLPQRPIRTVAVAALLVAQRGLDPQLVTDITAALYAQRSDLTDDKGQQIAVTRRIREKYNPAEAAIPYHAGAVAYYQREDPSFVVKYAEALSLGLTLLIGLYSGYIALREWLRRRMKNRIDAYLIEVAQQTADLATLSRDELIRRRDVLNQLRHRAFSDLVAEQLQANEAFSIFQNHLRDEFAAIEARIQEMKS